jgi:hypothetical protein
MGYSFPLMCEQGGNAPCPWGTGSIPVGARFRLECSPSADPIGKLTAGSSVAHAPRKEKQSGLALIPAPVIPSATRNLHLGCIRADKCRSFGRLRLPQDDTVHGPGSAQPVGDSGGDRSSSSSGVSAPPRRADRRPRRAWGSRRRRPSPRLGPCPPGCRWREPARAGRPPLPHHRSRHPARPRCGRRA